MQTSVNLQEPFTYSIIILLIFVLLSILATIFLICLYKKNKLVIGDTNKIKEIPQKNIKNIPVIKGKYIGKLDEVEYKYLSKTIDIRQAYQQISECVRMFVFEITDISTQNYTLKEIKKLNIPILYNLIEEYYEPEFASRSESDFNKSIEKAKGVIKKWN